MRIMLLGLKGILFQPFAISTTVTVLEGAAGRRDDSGARRR